MRYGSGLSITAPNDLSAIRDFAQALDGAGFDFTTTSGHVLGAATGRYEGRPTMTYVGPFHDPFVLFGYLAGITQRLHFINSILILPAHPTALVAKQAAELDFVSGGRFELGVGLSWSPDEYEALGQPFKNRARRLDEQIEVLRRLWSEPVVSFEGRYHRLNGVGLNRPPLDIPIWFGTTLAEAPMRRVARLADGWIPQGDAVEGMEKLREYMAEAGRDPEGFRMMGRLPAAPEGPDAWIAAGKRLQAGGATHLSISAPPGTAPAEALRLILEAKRVLSEALG